MKRTLSELETLRAQDLLVQRATHGLDAAEHAELVGLEAHQLDGFELTAAAIDLATLPEEALPPILRDKILATALATAAFARAAAPQASLTAPAVPAVAAALPEREPALRPRAQPGRGAADVRPRRRPWAPWATAAVAVMLAAAAWGWVAVRAPSAPGADGPSLRAMLDANDPTRVILPGGGVANGDVVWSGARQRGYLRVVGLPVNAPSTQQYQIWIVDRARDARYPVDGGVFDVTSTGEVVLPIVPRIPVTDPARVLVTAEKAGGTVVSERTTVVFATE